MPAYEDLIAGQEMRDLVVYLYRVGPKTKAAEW